METGSHCKEESGQLMPLINLNACEGKGPCVDVCPYGVLEMRAVSDQQFRELFFFGKMKTRAHGRDKAFVFHADRCHACGLCVTACPEKAIKLGRRI